MFLCRNVYGQWRVPHRRPSTYDRSTDLRLTASPVAEDIRLRLADAWGEMGAAWGVAPAIARVHAYLMARRSR